MGLNFYRWGGLSPVVQRGFDKSMPTFHAPPAKRGIYAFPDGCIERFLLTGANKKHRNERPRKFSHNGPICHHLKYPAASASARSEIGSWILNDFIVYKECLRKELHRLKSHSWHRVGMNCDGGVGGADAQKNFLVSTLQGVIIDHMEVFIEKIKA